MKLKIDNYLKHCGSCDTTKFLSEPCNCGADKVNRKKIMLSRYTLPQLERTLKSLKMGGCVLRSSPYSIDDVLNELDRRRGCLK